MKLAGSLLLARMPPTFAAAKKTYCGRVSANRRSTARRSVRSVSRRERRMRFEQPWALRARTMADPTSPLWPAMKIRLLSSMHGPALHYGVSRVDQHLFPAGQFHVVIDHHPDQVGKVDFRLPAQFTAGLGGIAQEVVDFSRPVIARVVF